jgi:hypothetical protein
VKRGKRFTRLIVSPDSIISLNTVHGIVHE